jgi:hypothetical protein
MVGLVFTLRLIAFTAAMGVIYLACGLGYVLVNT